MTPNKNNFNICVVGLGYVGLPLAARFSIKGFNVIGFDINENRVNELKDHNDCNDDISIENLETLNRKSNTLSGGESQRIRLASQIGSGLTGILYVLDEPSIGLHQRDNIKLIETLKNLRNLGNTVIVVEHDEEAMFASDYIVDIGVGAGLNGGNIIA